MYFLKCGILVVKSKGVEHTREIAHTAPELETYSIHLEHNSNYPV